MLSKNKLQFDFWDSRRKTLFSRTGGWRVGESVYCRGQDLLADRLIQKSFFQNMIFILTGREFTRSQADWVEAAFVGMSYPDARIWCNQIGALAGATRASAVAANCAGVLAADSAMYGIKPLLNGLGFIQQALKDHQNGLSAEDIVAREIKKNRGKVYIMGYARPIASGDERIPIMEKYAQELGLECGEHMILAKKIEVVLQREYGESMNFNGYSAAFLSDQGVNPEDAYNVSALTVGVGVTACYLDNVSRPPEAFLPLRCADIDYQGTPLREVPSPDDETE